MAGAVLTARWLLNHRYQRGDERDRDLVAGLIRTRAAYRDQDAVLVKVTSNLDATNGRCYYHWYVDGHYYGRTRVGRRVLRAPPDRQIHIVVRAVRWRRYPPRLHPPARLSGTFSFEWIASSDADVDHYLAQYQPSGGSWTTFARVRHDGRWSYRVSSPQLADDTEYNFRVVPVDSHDNQGTALSLGSQRVVRYPDITEPDITWDSGTGKFTFDEA